jgi:ubiquinone/menaquinone biosynthesis C-methylase UbiE
MPSTTALYNEMDATQKKALGLIGFDGVDAEYCPYTETSKNYDLTRRPPAMELALSLLQPRKDQKLLDVGAGTGTFVEAVRQHYAHVTALEYNEGMIEQANKRFQGNPEVQFMQGSADALPFAEASFDAVTMNQVVHHFSPEGNYTVLRDAFKEIFRVLKPGGTFFLNHSTPEQVRDGFWWTGLMPKVTEAKCVEGGKAAALEVVLTLMREAGFAVTQSSAVVPVHATLMHEDKYLKGYGLEGAFEKSYRDGDSDWSLCEALGELPEVQAKIREMQAAGTAEIWLRQREVLRQTVGQIIFITVNKPL